MDLTNKKAILILESGLYFNGYAIGEKDEAYGEVVFNTSHTGYQEILTDPSYKGQIVCLTYPHIGNCGLNDEDVESFKPFVNGFIVRDPSPVVSNWRAKISLEDFLSKHKISCIYGIDTRYLTKHIREIGAMRGLISTSDFNIKSLMKKVKQVPSIVNVDLVKFVTCEKNYLWNEKLHELLKIPSFQFKNKRVAVYDFGVKYNILRNISLRGAEIKVFNAYSSYKNLLEIEPDGVILSNGPGDPQALKEIIENLKKLIVEAKMRKIPVFGICLGHQLIALSCGGSTFKLKFGHHGANHPVKNLITGKIEITSQNHGFAVEMSSDKLKNLPDFKLTHINLNDSTVEGMEHKEYPIFSVQYHPEASPGPLDSQYLFDKFFNVM